MPLLEWIIFKKYATVMKKDSLTAKVNFKKFNSGLFGKKISARIILAVIIFVAVNIVAGGVGFLKLDLTEGKLYSLSASTKDIIAKIDHDIEIKFYVSEDLLKAAPNYIVFEERVRLLLEEMANHNQHIRFTHIKPEPFSQEEDEAVALGIKGAPLNQQGEKVYFGIHMNVVGLQDKSGAIGFLQIERERFLEYDIVKLLTEISKGTIPKIGVLSSVDPLGAGILNPGRPTSPWAIFEDLQKNYDVEYVFSAENLFKMQPDMLLITHLVDPSDELLWAIEQYLMRGGRALIYADPVFESGVVLGPYLSSLNSTKDLNKIFNNWGVKIADEQVVVDPNFGILVNIGKGSTIQPIIHSAWLRYGPQQLASSDLVTSDLDILNLATIGEIHVKEPGKVQLDALITSSTDSQLYDAARLSGNEPDLEAILNNFTGEGQERILAARIIGSFETVFAKGKPAAQEGFELNDKDFVWPKSLKKSEKPFQVILVADVDMLQDRFWVQRDELFGEVVLSPFAGNGGMLENAVENLSGSTALAQLRSRGTRQRPFILLNNIRHNAEQRYRVRANELSRRLEEVQEGIYQLQNVPDLDEETFASNQEKIEEQLVVMFETQRELRIVKRDLNRDFERVTSLVKGFNIFMMPFFVIIAGILVFRWRRKIRRA